MATSSLPSPAMLRQLMDYDSVTGKFTWLTREPSTFTDGKYSAERLCSQWNSAYAGKPALANMARNGYLRGNVWGSVMYAHRVAWAHHYDEHPRVIDHINGNVSDNRIMNLRNVTSAINGRNMALSHSSMSGVIGVNWVKLLGKWHSTIMVDGRKHNLGYYDSFREAVAQRRAAEARFDFHPNHGRQGPLP